MAVPVQVTGTAAVGVRILEVGLAAPAVHVCGGAKSIVKIKIAPAVAPNALKALCEFRVPDFLIPNFSFGGGVGCPEGSRRTTPPILQKGSKVDGVM
jgi:hypothetical protein